MAQLLKIIHPCTLRINVPEQTSVDSLEVKLMQPDVHVAMMWIG